MSNHTQPRMSFNPRALAGFVLFCAVLAGLIALDMRWVGVALSLVYVAALLVGSLIVIVRSAKGSQEPGRARLGQAAALPRRWRQWVLDEEDRKAR